MGLWVSYYLMLVCVLFYALAFFDRTLVVRLLHEPEALYVIVLVMLYNITRYYALVVMNHRTILVGVLGAAVSALFGVAVIAFGDAAVFAPRWLRQAGLCVFMAIYTYLAFVVSFLDEAGFNVPVCVPILGFCRPAGSILSGVVGTLLALLFKYLLFGYLYPGRCAILTFPVHVDVGLSSDPVAASPEVELTTTHLPSDTQTDLKTQTEPTQSADPDPPRHALGSERTEVT
jgi:hypothetical protein